MTSSSADVALLVSPAAGRGRGAVLAVEVLAAFREAGFVPEGLPATSAAEAERQAAKAVAAGTRAGGGVGGDGAVHAALQAGARGAAPPARGPAGAGDRPGA